MEIPQKARADEDVTLKLRVQTELRECVVVLFRASPAALLLVLCLQLGINNTQEDTISRKALIANVEMPKKARAGDEITLKLEVRTELRECVVIKAYLKSNKSIGGTFNYKYTTCLCEDYPRTFYWDIQTNRVTSVPVCTVAWTSHFSSMSTLQHLLKPNSITLLLVLFLSLGTSTAQKDEQEILSVDIKTVQENNANEVLAVMTVTNNMDRPMVIKVSTENNPSITYPNGHFVYIACVSGTRTFFWDIIVSETTDIVGIAEVVSDENICLPGEDLYPAVGYRVSATYTIY
ncbi:Prolactin-inducible protein like protein [Fukomys damarensis]|uniref:Prolactin-induced protein n=1 Tax=Fukomys damarensis TaxID=885580 RepID=A0A091DH41_FUKDA|nr:Prolactin-inducible protein like protein [Fukomys damarensis]